MHYSKWGHGKQVLIAFHGFGRSYTDFIPFTVELESVFTIYGFDLFFHGESTIGERKPDSNPLKPEELEAYLDAFLTHIEAEEIWLLGCSLGGRICLKIAELMPEKVRGLYLFAPDGLAINFWYAVSSYTSTGRAAFRFMIRHNILFFKLLNFCNALGIVNNKRKAFVLSQIKSTDAQWKVYKVWTFLRLIEPDFKKLEAALNENSISVNLFIGKNDSVIPPKLGRKFKKKFPAVNYHVIESGHAILRPDIIHNLLEKGLLNLPD